MATVEFDPRSCDPEAVLACVIQDLGGRLTVSPLAFSRLVEGLVVHAEYDPVGGMMTYTLGVEEGA